MDHLPPPNIRADTSGIKTGCKRGELSRGESLPPSVEIRSPESQGWPGSERSENGGLQSRGVAGSSVICELAAITHAESLRVGHRVEGAGLPS